MAEQEPARSPSPQQESPRPERNNETSADHTTSFWRTMTELDRVRDRYNRPTRSYVGVDVDGWLDPALNFLRRHEERSSRFDYDQLRVRRFGVTEAPPEDNTEATIDFRNLEPVSEPDSNLFCPICHCLFVQPVLLPCEHVFCSECLKNTPDDQGNSTGTSLSCPSCRRRCDRKWFVKVPKIIERILDDIVVKCPSATSGCRETIPRAGIENHVTRYCEYTLVDCPSEECGEMIERRLAEQGCLHNLKPCDDCNTDVMEVNLQKHRRNSCKEAYDECPGCSQLFRALEVNDHTNTCPDMEVGCDGQDYGCKFTAKRTEISSHVAECLLAQAGPFLSKQVARIDNHESTIKDLRLKNRVLTESVTTMHSTVREVLGEDSNNNNSAADPQSSTNQPFDSQIAHLLDLHTSVEDQIRRIEAAVATLDAKIEVQTLNHNLRATEEKLHRDTVETHMRRQLQWLVSAKLQSQRAASSLLRAAGQDPIAGASGSQPALDRRRSDEAIEARGTNVLPRRRSSDGGREKL